MKVLVVDDEPLIRRSLEKVFTKNGHEVISSDNGLDGLELWTKHQPELVFLDVLMPGMTGPEVIQKIPLPRSSKVILISAFTGDLKLESKYQPDLFLKKPFENIFSVYEEALQLVKK